jgi:DNA-binding NarL/FixJ family response regulator
MLEQDVQSDLCDAGRQALGRCDWQAARKAFEAALEREASPEAFAGLADACSWLDDEEATFAAREQAFRAFLDRGDRANAARTALWLGTDSLEFRGEPAVANGWIQRARSLLDGLEPQAAHGWLAAWEGHLALMLRNDTASARSLGEKASQMGRAYGDVNLEIMGTAVQGLSLLSQGHLVEGAPLLDEAATAVMSGEVSDLGVAAAALCYLMDGCSRVRDFDRASQWCTRAQDFMERHNFASLFSVCRPLYAVVLMWRGAWSEAEQELTVAVRDIVTCRPPMVVEATVRLAELRWRQGRWDEAADLFKQVEGEGLAQLGRGELALSQGDAATAMDLAERHLRRIPPEDRIERVAGLELMVRAAASKHDAEAARSALEELQSIADLVAIDSLRAAASLAAGVLEAACGDLDQARLMLEDAADFYERSRAPFEAARARMELALVLQRLGLGLRAEEEAGQARESFERLGAVREAARAATFSRQAGLRTAAVDEAGLSAREVDVLRLLAAGRSNQQIADELVLSVRTVERHISNIYSKLGADGKVARASATAYAVRHHLV